MEYEDPVFGFSDTLSEETKQSLRLVLFGGASSLVATVLTSVYLALPSIQPIVESTIYPFNSPEFAHAMCEQIQQHLCR